MTHDIAADLASLRIDRDPSPPRRRPSGWWLIGAAVLIGGGLAATLVPKAIAGFFPTEVAVTTVTTLSPVQASVDLTATGYVVPQIVVKVGAKVAGRIATVRIGEGDKVTAGSVLFTLDASTQQSALATAQAKSGAARARAAASRDRVAVAKAALHETQLQYDRQSKLAEANAVAPATATDLAARLQSQSAQVRSAEADARAADADATAADAEVRALQVDLANATILAPVTGVAQTKPARVGDVVTQQSVLVELTDPQSLLVEVDVPEAKLGQVQPGTPCEVVLDAYPSTRLRAAVVDVSPRLNRAKATGTAKVKLIDQSKRLLPEMAARVSFLAKALAPEDMQAQPKPIIPAAAVVERQGAKVAFELQQGKVRQVTVVLGEPLAGGFELKSGPAAGAKLVSNPPADLADGQTVKEKGGS